MKGTNKIKHGCTFWLYLGSYLYTNRVFSFFSWQIIGLLTADIWEKNFSNIWRFCLDIFDPNWHDDFVLSWVKIIFSLFFEENLWRSSMPIIIGVFISVFLWQFKIWQVFEATLTNTIHWKIFILGKGTFIWMLPQYKIQEPVKLDSYWLCVYECKRRK